MIDKILKIVLALPTKTQTWIILLVIVLTAGYFIYKEQLAHQERLTEIMNKYSSEKRSLEIELENCR